MDEQPWQPSHISGPIVATLRDAKGYLVANSWLVWLVLVAVLGYLAFRPQISKRYDEFVRKRRKGGWYPTADVPLADVDPDLAAARQRQLQRLKDTEPQRAAQLEALYAEQAREQAKLLQSRLDYERKKRDSFDYDPLTGRGAGAGRYRPTSSMRNVPKRG